MTSDPPPVIEYRRPDPGRKSDPHAARKFAIGIGVAFGIGAAGGGIGSLTGSASDPYMPLVVWFLFTPAAGLLAGLVLLALRKTRMIGLGVLAVWGVVALILGSLCLR